MSNMDFLPRLKDYLRDHGLIYTVRKYKYDSSTCEVEGVGLCKRELVKQITELSELKPYVSQSGFSTMAGWSVRIRGFINSHAEMYLYRVVVLK